MKRALTCGVLVAAMMLVGCGDKAASNEVDARDIVREVFADFDREGHGESKSQPEIGLYTATGKETSVLGASTVTITLDRQNRLLTYIYSGKPGEVLPGDSAVGSHAYGKLLPLPDGKALVAFIDSSAVAMNAGIDVSKQVGIWDVRVKKARGYYDLTIKRKS